MEVLILQRNYWIFLRRGDLMKSLGEKFIVGQKIYIMRDDNENTWYPSQILDIINNNEFIISGPIKKNNLIIIQNGGEIRLSYTVENKGKYTFKAKVKSKDYSDVYSLRVERTSKIDKIQLREYFRIWSDIEVSKKHLIKNKDEIIEFIEKTDAKDISGGGVKLYCNFKHSIGDEIMFNAKVGDIIIKGKGTVKRINEIDTFDYKYSIGIKFTEIEEETRELIIRYIFEQQRILRDKGLI
jgi:c-di-GMP-binding flagellar brake protein YcgR